MSDHVIEAGTVFNTASLTSAEALTLPNAAGWFAARIAAVYRHGDSLEHQVGHYIYMVVHISEVTLSINVIDD